MKKQLLHFVYTVVYRAVKPPKSFRDNRELAKKRKQWLKKFDA